MSCTCAPPASSPDMRACSPPRPIKRAVVVADDEALRNPAPAGQGGEPRPMALRPMRLMSWGNSDRASYSRKPVGLTSGRRSEIGRVGRKIGARLGSAWSNPLQNLPTDNAGNRSNGKPPVRDNWTSGTLALPLPRYVAPCNTGVPERMSTRCRQRRNDMPSSDVARLPRSVTAGTSRTVMSPMLTRSSTTGATRAAIGGADALGVVAVANVRTRALRVIVGERDDRSAESTSTLIDRPLISTLA